MPQRKEAGIRPATGGADRLAPIVDPDRHRDGVPGKRTEPPQLAVAGSPNYRLEVKLLRLCTVRIHDVRLGPTRNLAAIVNSTYRAVVAAQQRKLYQGIVVPAERKAF